MKILGVIPARWASTRFPGKVLADILGKPMIQHVWERSRGSRLLDDVIVACDHERVEKAAKQFGAKTILTSPEHASGTDRIIEVVKKLRVDADIIVNIQGDEPLISPDAIDAAAEVLVREQACPMATVITPIRNRADLENPNVVKVVIDGQKNALYFSRRAIPYVRDSKEEKKVVFFKHLGIYAYRKDFLLSYKDLAPSILEKAEQLEQLRVLEAGCQIKTVETPQETIGVDTPEDIKRVEAVLKSKS